MGRWSSLVTICLITGFFCLGTLHPGATWGQVKAGGVALSKVEVLASLPQPNLRASSLVTPRSWSLQDFFKFLAEGYLAGLLWFYLFRFPQPLWREWYWFVGFLDLVVIATVVYLGYDSVKFLFQRGRPAMSSPSPAESLAATTTVLEVEEKAAPQLERIMDADPNFNLPVFFAYTRQVILDLHDGWNRGDLETIRNRLNRDLFNFLREGLEHAAARGEIHRLDKLTLERLAVSRAGQEQDREFIILNLRGQILDYVLSRDTFKLVSGSTHAPVPLDENWLFERQRGKRAWLLARIESLSREAPAAVAQEGQEPETPDSPTQPPPPSHGHFTE